MFSKVSRLLREELALAPTPAKALKFATRRRFPVEASLPPVGVAYPYGVTRSFCESCHSPYVAAPIPHAWGVLNFMSLSA